MSETRIIPIVMPKWGLSMSEGKLGAWLKKPGDLIAVGDEILEVETDKISNVVEAGDAGKLRRIIGTPDTVYPVKALLAVLADDSVGEDEIDAYVAAFETPAAAGEGEGEAADRYAFLELPVGRIRYAREGSGPHAVVLVHGFGGDADNWLFNIGALAEDSTVYALDLPGHGQSTKALADASIGGLTATLAAFMDALGIEKADLVGHSMGGAVILRLAVEAPERVRSLSLICSAGLGSEIDAGYIEGFVRAGSRKELKPVLERLFVEPGLVGRQMIDELLKYKRLDGVQEALTALSGNLFADGRQSTVLRDALAGLSCPVLVVWGAQDRVIPMQHGQGLPATVRSETIEGAGHMVQMERSTQVNDLIGRHLAGTSRGA